MNATYLVFDAKEHNMVKSETNKKFDVLCKLICLWDFILLKARFFLLLVFKLVHLKLVNLIGWN